MRSAKARQYLAAYFTVPSRKGFSAYRSGWIVHFVFSVLLAELTWLGLGRIGANYLPLRAAGTFLTVLASWGAGALLGILSHYNPLLTLLAMAGALASFRFFGDFAPVGFVIGTVAHCASLLLLSLLQRLRRNRSE